jgi:hypothetical protein
MTNKQDQWLYYKSKKKQGSISLEELFEGFESGRFDFFTWFKPPRSIYWSRITNSPHYLAWCYIANEVIYKVSAKELLSLCKEGIISSSTYVRFDGSSDWQHCKELFLEGAFHKEKVSPAFYGYHTLPPHIKFKIANLIDNLLFIASCFYFMLQSVRFIVGSQKEFSLAAGILEILVVLPVSAVLFSGFQAFLLHLFGWTLGSKAMNFYVYTSKKETLTFVRALKLQLIKNFENFHHSTWNSSKEKEHYEEFGINREYVEYSIIISNDPPCVAESLREQ